MISLGGSTFEHGTAAIMKYVCCVHKTRAKPLTPNTIDERDPRRYI